jgi:hypothetical protein
MAINFVDVEPHVLADEEARDDGQFGAPLAPSWQAYLRRVLPALERGSANEMAQALLATDTAGDAAVTHSETMRRRALATGDVRRARFWDDVMAAIRRG